MTKYSSLNRLTDDNAVARDLSALIEADARLAPIWAMTGPVSMRYADPGFPGLAKIVCGQQLSVASARAIWARFCALEGALEPHTYLSLAETEIRATGMSNGKYRTLTAIAQALTSATLDLAAIEAMSAEDAAHRLTALHGVGPWTAELYLLFCTGHPDIFPTGDLALQKAVARGLSLGERVLVPELSQLTLAWAPWRGAAALLFWAYFAHMRDKEGIIL